MKTALGFALGFGLVCIMASIFEKSNPYWSMDFEYDPDWFGDMTGLKEGK